MIKGREPERSGSATEVFAAFLKLGLTAFGGPIAHIGYFRDEFVVRRRWLDDEAYGKLVALCQFLPGPASSQTGFALGLLRAGPLGALAAWTGFTLPSALLMLGFAYVSAALEGPLAQAAIHGLKLAAVAIVAQALWGMARTLTPDLRRAIIALAAGAFVLIAGSAWAQIGAILLGMAAGELFCRNPKEANGAIRLPANSRRSGVVCLGFFALLLIILPVGAAISPWQPLALFDVFYRAGALVFGGGHVVLPLLHESLVPRWISDQDFLSGYGAAQALPGPLFAFAAYLGGVSAGIGGAATALVAIFLPGLLLVAGALPFWTEISRNPSARAATAGANAAVVGILGAALYDPLWTSSIMSPIDAVIAVAAFLLFAPKRLPPLALVAFTVIAAVSAGLAR